MWSLPISLLLAFATSGILADHHESSQILGFVSGSRTPADAKIKTIGDYRKEFDLATTMKDIPGKFNSVRLYTMVDEATSYERGALVKPNPAIKAALDTNTRMLLGIWCSNTKDIAAELKALEAAMVWGPKFAELVVGISVGHEDIYRYISEGPRSGKTLDEILVFVDKVRKAIKGTLLEKKPVGHSEPWVVFANINSSFVNSLDFVGANIMPFYDSETEKVGMAKQFDTALAAVRDKSMGKPVWVTETGWPITGESTNKNKASVANACDFWQEIGCRRLFNKVNVWWYNLRDSNRGLTNSYAISKNLTTEPMFDLACKKEEPKKEEPKKEEPKKEEPKKEEPKKEEPKKEEPKKDEPKKEEPKKDEPKKEEPKKDEPKKDGPNGDEKKWTVSPAKPTQRVVVVTVTIPDNENPSPTS